jgi:natural product precursor
MKTLSKIKLQNAVALEEQEMKRIYGGSGGSQCSKDANGVCSGSCSDGTLYDSNGRPIGTFKRSCNSYAGSGGAIICMCG